MFYDPIDYNNFPNKSDDPTDEAEQADTDDEMWMCDLPPWVALPYEVQEDDPSVDDLNKCQDVIFSKRYDEEDDPSVLRYMWAQDDSDEPEESVGMFDGEHANWEVAANDYDDNDIQWAGLNKGEC